MEKRLSAEEMGRVAAEVARLAQQREDHERETLNREQIAEALRELDLPVDLINDAMEQLRRREALERERKRKKRIIAAVAAVVIAVILLVSVSMWRHSAALARITTDQQRITYVDDDGGSLDKVTRSGQEVFYRVTLRDVPLDERLSLTCNWLDPSGNIFHQNRYQTGVTDKSVWPTQCKCQIGEAAPRGAWRVEMRLGNRVLSSQSFEVE